MMSLPFILHLEEFSKARDGKILAVSIMFECLWYIKFFEPMLYETQVPTIPHIQETFDPTWARFMYSPYFWFWAYYVFKIEGNV